MIIYFQVAAKSSKTEQSKESLKSPRKVDLSPVKITSPSNSPSSSSLSRDGFQGFEDTNFGEEEVEKRKEFFSFVGMSFFWNLLFVRPLFKTSNCCAILTVQFIVV